MNKKQTMKKLKMVLIGCLIMVSCITEKVSLVYADESASINVLFDQEFIGEGGKRITTADRELIYELVAKESSNPMPTGSVGGVYETTLKGNAADDLKIIFDQVGKFEYTLKASAKNDLRGLIPTGETSYRLEVTVLKKMSGELEPFAFAFNSDGEKILDPPFVYTVQDTHNVKYGFQSGTKGMGDLPQAVKDMLPATEHGKLDGDVVTPSSSLAIGTTVEANGGTWTFIGWEPTSQTVDGEDVMFIGIWEFKSHSGGETPKEPEHDPQSPTIKRPTSKPLARPVAATKKGGIAKTGDTTKIYTLVALAAASAGLVILAVVKRRRRDEE